MNVQVYYPAIFSDTEFERNTGVLPVDEHAAPCPVGIIMPGINVDPSGYRGLADAMVSAGIVVICYTWIAEEMPGFVSLTPGMNLAMVRPDTYGSGPTSPVITPLFQALQGWNETGRLAGSLDLNHIFLIGHSAGGTMALQNARPDWFRGLAGVISYAGHTGAATALGFEPKTVLPVANCAPALILGGTEDGVIAASSHRYGAESSATAPLHATFSALQPQLAGSCVLAIFAKAGHFTVVAPIDQTNGRHFLEAENEASRSPELRKLIGNVMIEFIRNISDGQGIDSLTKILDSHSAVAEMAVR